MSVAALFKDFHSVPGFQRGYVWQHEQAGQLLQDLSDEFYDDQKSIFAGLECFLGSVVYKGEAPTSRLIDGQQRITTHYLILCVIRDMLKELETAPSKVLNSQIADQRWPVLT